MLSYKTSTKQMERRAKQKASPFEKVYYEYRTILLQISMAILKNQMLAEDVVHDTLMRYLKKYPPGEMTISPETKSYLVAVTKGLSFNILKQEAKRGVVHSMEELLLIDDPTLSVEGADELFFEKYEEQILISAIKALPEIYSTILFLKYNHDYQDKDLAKILGISYELARKRVQRARELLIIEIMKREKGGLANG